MEEIQLRLNDAKTAFIIIRTSYTLKKKHDNIEIGETTMHWIPKIKILEVYSDEL